MKKVLALSLVVTGGLIWGPSHAEGVPDLQSSIEQLSGAELQAFEVQAAESPITEMVDVAVEISIESGEVPEGLAPELSSELVSQALAEGFITETEAEGLTTTIELYEANEQYFDFDFSARIQAAIAANALTVAEAAEMMQAFNRLSVAGKTLVGQSDFDFDDSTSPMNTLTDADRDIICSIACDNEQPR